MRGEKVIGKGSVKPFNARVHLGGSGVGVVVGDVVCVTRAVEVLANAEPLSVCTSMMGKGATSMSLEKVVGTA